MEKYRLQDLSDEKNKKDGEFLNESSENNENELDEFLDDEFEEDSESSIF